MKEASARKATERITGQTQNGLFQIGVSKSLPYTKQRIWNFLTSPIGLQIVLGDDIDPEEIQGKEGTGASGIAYKVTTFKPLSHFRLQWRLLDWPFPSILQIRVTAKDRYKTVLTIHQEKLKDSNTRELMKHYWQERMGEIQNHLKIQVDQNSPSVDSQKKIGDL